MLGFYHQTKHVHPVLTMLKITKNALKRVTGTYRTPFRKGQLFDTSIVDRMYVKKIVFISSPHECKEEQSR